MANVDSYPGRRVLIWKADDAPEPARESETDVSAQVELVKKERDEALAKAQAAEVELQKRRIGWAGAAPADSPVPTQSERKTRMADPMTLPEIEEKEAEWAQLGVELEDDLQKLKADPATPQAMIQRHEKGIGALHKAYVALRRPDDVTADEARHAHEAAGRSEGLQSALSKAESLSKYDKTLSSAAAFREAMRDPAVQKAYYDEMGTAPPVAFARPAGLVKAEPSQPSQADVASVGEYAQELMKSEGLSANAAFRRAMAESGVEYASAA